MPHKKQLQISGIYIINHECFCETKSNYIKIIAKFFHYSKFNVNVAIFWVLSLRDFLDDFIRVRGY